MNEELSENLVRRLLHGLAHLTGWNHGRVETWYAGQRLMVGFRCSCGKLTGVHPCQTETKLSSPNAEPITNYETDLPTT
jgi:hypothetical protein